ncbi:MAG TPA: helix-turn-helix domain-containing protein [Candidatus Acidoferrum sp.]|nr:helix-turn-helix domain-containing protein [Candidatus Acidoferrum sp.]
MINAQIVLKTLCSIAKSSQEDLADALGISVTQAKRILKGSYDLPKFIKQDEFAAIFGRYCTDYFASDEQRMAGEYLTSFRDEISEREYREIEGIYQNGSFDALIKELWRKSYPDPNKNKRQAPGEKPAAKSAEPRQQATVSPPDSAYFTLRHLFAMLTGGEAGGENWAASLCRQLGAAGSKPPESADLPVVLMDFASDDAFLRSVFPGAVLESLAGADFAAVMDGAAPTDVKIKVCRQLQSDCGMSFRGLIKKCGTLLELADLNAFYADTAFLLAALGGETPAQRRLTGCFRRSADDNEPCRGLAVLAVFALLGPAHFLRLVPKESDYILFAQ